MNSPWDFITSLGIHFYTINDEKLKPGNKVCEVEKRYCIVEENLDSLRDDFICNASGCNSQFNSVSELESHQRARHTHVCMTCKAIFPSFHLLDCHVMETHDSFFQIVSQKKPMYACLVEYCKELFQTALDRKQHCMKEHKFPYDFRFDLQWRKLKLPKKQQEHNNNTSNTNKKGKKKPKSNESKLDKKLDEDMEIVCNEYINEYPDSAKIPTKSPNKAPKLISFGIGVPRGFVTNKEYNKRKHWHQKNKPDNTHKNIEQISLNDMNQALEEVEAMED